MEERVITVPESCDYCQAIIGWTLLIAYDTVKVAYVCTEHTVIRVPDKTAFANGAQGVRAGRLYLRCREKEDRPVLRWRCNRCGSRCDPSAC